jgi:hypothetical protein
MGVVIWGLTSYCMNFHPKIWFFNQYGASAPYLPFFDSILIKYGVKFIKYGVRLQYQGTKSPCRRLTLNWKANMGIFGFISAFLMSLNVPSLQCAVHSSCIAFRNLFHLNLPTIIFKQCPLAVCHNARIPKAHGFLLENIIRNQNPSQLSCRSEFRS